MPKKAALCYTFGEKCGLEGTFINPPGDDVFVFTNIGGKWWPQPYSLHVTGNNTWSVKLHFGTYGPTTLSIVRANELGVGLIRYYRKIVALNRERAERMKLRFHNIGLENQEGILKALGGDYPAIEMARLPKGIEVQAQVEFIVENPRNQSK